MKEKVSYSKMSVHEMAFFKTQQCRIDFISCRIKV